MRIVDGNLIKVYDSDIVNGTFEIPASVISIEEYAFDGCSNLEKSIYLIMLLV